MQIIDAPPPCLLPRSRDAHKGDFGRALLIGGSQGMAGAIALSGMAALRGGAGLVTVATAAVCQDVVASFDPCYMTVGLAADPQGRIDGSEAAARLMPFLEATDCLAIGPGLGRSEPLDRWVEQLFFSCSRPLVCDADALNALAARKAEWTPLPAPRILTPHPGEFQRLLQRRVTNRHDQEAAAAAWAAKHGGIVVLKGADTLITDGQTHYHNPTGNPGMATGGSGDVLTGLICALLGQGLDPLAAARLGVYVHGLAGDLAARERGQVALTARDLLAFLGPAFLHHRS